MDNTKQIVVINLGEVQYGFPIEEVNEIIKYIPPTKVPNAPSYSEGVISIRGKVHSVIDLGTFLGMEKKQTDKNTKIIIASEQSVGLIVDDVSKIVKPKDEEIDTNINLPTFFNNYYISYVLKIDGSLIFVLDMSSILSTK